MRIVFTPGFMQPAGAWEAVSAQLGQRYSSVLLEHEQHTYEGRIGELATAHDQAIRQYSESIAGAEDAVTAATYTKLAYFDLQILVPIVAIALVCASLGGMLTWLAGPSKGLLMIARREGYLPPFFQHQNENEVAVNILVVQGAITTVIATGVPKPAIQPSPASGLRSAVRKLKKPTAVVKLVRKVGTKFFKRA